MPLVPLQCHDLWQFSGTLPVLQADVGHCSDTASWTGTAMLENIHHLT